MRSFLMRQIVDLARQCGRTEEQLAVAHRRIRQLEADNAMLAEELARK